MILRSYVGSLYGMRFQAAACIHIFFTIGSKIIAISTRPKPDIVKTSEHLSQYLSSWATLKCLRKTRWCNIERLHHSNKGYRSILRESFKIVLPFSSGYDS